MEWIQTAVVSSFDTLDQAMLFAFSPSMITMDRFFPGLNTMWGLILTVSFAMVLALCIYKIFQNSFLTASKAYESPFWTILRTVFAFVVITALPYFLKILFDFADSIYWQILEDGGMLSSDVGASILGESNHNLGTKLMEGTRAAFKDGILQGTGDLAIDALTPADNLPVYLITLILTVAIGWEYFKLMLEVAERYVVIGIMYYTMPLAAVPLVSRDTSSITKSWIRMLVSELLILGLNVWFLVIFRAAILDGPMASLEGYEVHGQTISGSSAGILWCFIAVAFLKTAQKIDSYIATLGLTTAQLSSGIATSILTTGFAMSRAAKGVTHAAKALNPTAFSNRATMRENAAARSADRLIAQGKQITPKILGDMSPAAVAQRALDPTKSQAFKDVSVQAAQKIAPDMFKNKNITSADFTGGKMTAQYKDANGKEGTLTFGQTRPDGISKESNIQGINGFVKDSGNSFNYDALNNGKTSFNEFADKYLGGEDNELSKSGRFTKQDLDGATVSADPSGDGVIVRDAEGMEMARITAFDDAHADGITDNTLVGEGSDGLYRADINPDERYPLPEGYSYAGEVLVDDNGNAISEVNSTGFTTGDNENMSGEFVNSNGEVVGNAHYQDSYLTPEGTYISSDEMQNMMNENTVKPSDYEANLNYDSSTGFTDANGNSVNMDKAGWVQNENDHDMYTNKFTGGSATGEQIADRYANPEYASQSYGGYDANGKETYFDNYSKASKSDGDMKDALKYGETPNYNGYSSDGVSGTNKAGAANFGESVENLMRDKNYSFSGDTGAKVAQAYIPELRGSKVDYAVVEKDSITVNKISNGSIYREGYISNVSERAGNGRFETVETTGKGKWMKFSAKGGQNASGTPNNGSRKPTSSQKDKRKKKR